VENADAVVLDRIRHVRDLKQSGHAAHTFVSFEPLLGLLPDDLDLTGIDWAYVGGESRQKRQAPRAMDPAWARRVRDLLINHGIPFLFKQWGDPSNNPDPVNDPSFNGDPHGKCQMDGDFFDWCP